MRTTTATVAFKKMLFSFDLPLLSFQAFSAFIKNVEKVFPLFFQPLSQIIECPGCFVQESVSKKEK